jgi:hypothetical protein
MRKEFIRALERGNCTFHLVLRVSSIENLVNENRDAALQILLLGMDIYGQDQQFLESVIKALINMKAHDEVSSVIRHAKEVLQPMKLVEMYKNLYDHLLYSMEHEQLMAEVEQEILKLDRSVTAEAMTLKRYFLPPDYVDRSMEWH